MAEAITQANSPMRFKAEALGDDDLLITRLSGSEGLSELFEFELEFLAPVDAPVAFEDVLGKGATVSLDLPDGEPRFIQGIISRFAQGPRDDKFLSYRATLVPPVWMLTRRVQSRIFQGDTVPEILGKVFAEFSVVDEIQPESPPPGDPSGPLTFYPRDYCVQYRESDFDFASRIMEEEGIYYYFRHTSDDCVMVLSNTPAKHDPVPAPAELIYEELVGGNKQEGRVSGWQKVQEVRPGQVTLWDHCFELPELKLEADQKIQANVAIGKVKHTLKLPIAEALEVYDYPGGYAGRFDGIAPSGDPQPKELEKIFEDNRRTARLRIQEEAARAVKVEGTSTARQLTSGHKFTLTEHFDADGDYVLTRVNHEAGLTGGGYRSGDSSPGMDYKNSFECIPFELPFRPERLTPKPTVKGTQTAVVVGPKKDEIFTDKYSRIKVQFHWDREGKFDADSSCWIRVATIWAGQGWGVIHIPRIGQEVVVDFLEGDPDQPIVIGSVYNKDQMPAYDLPANATQSGTKSRSSKKGTTGNFNEIKFEDKKGEELVTIHAEKDMSTSVENNNTRSVGNNHSDTIGTDPKGDPKKNGTSTTTVFGDTKYTVTKGDYAFTVATGKADYTVQGAVTETYKATQSTTVTKTIDIKTEEGYIHIHSPKEIKLSVGDKTHITMTPDTITIHTANIKFEGTTKIEGVTPDLNLEGSTQAQMHGKAVKVDGTSEATFQSSKGTADFTAMTKANLGVDSQTVVCDGSKVAISGKAVDSHADGVHTITGNLVKLN